VGDPLLLLGPRDPLHPEAAGGTPDAVGRIHQPEGLIPQGERLPAAGGAAAFPAGESAAGQALHAGEHPAIRHLLDLH
jgi:hypothetical protein